LTAVAQHGVSVPPGGIERPTDGLGNRRGDRRSEIGHICSESARSDCLTRSNRFFCRSEAGRLVRKAGENLVEPPESPNKVNVSLSTWGCRARGGRARTRDGSWSRLPSPHGSVDSWLFHFSRSVTNQELGGRGCGYRRRVPLGEPRGRTHHRRDGDPRVSSRAGFPRM